MRYIFSYFLLVVTTILGGLGLSSHSSPTPISQQANVVSSVVSKPTPTVSKVAVITPTPTPTVVPTTKPTVVSQVSKQISYLQSNLF